MIIAFDARFLVHGSVHPHSRLVHIFLRRNREVQFPVKLILYTDRSPVADNFARQYAAPNVVVTVIGRSGGRWRRLAWLWLNLPQALKRDEVKVFYSSFYFLPPRVPGVRLINSIHDCCVFYIDPALNRGLLSSPLYLRVLKRMIQWTNRRADATVTVSHFSKSMLIQHLGLSANCVKVCYHGVENSADGDNRPTSSSAENRPYFLFVGSNLPKKNIRQCIAGYARLPEEIRRNYRMLLKTSCYPENRAQIAELGVADGVKFVDGRLDDAAMAELFSGASLLLLLSFDEGFGLPIIEAFAANVPVLTSNRAACGELVTLEECKADPENTAEIAAKWRALATDDSLRAACLSEQRRLLRQFQPEAAAGSFHAALIA